MTDPNELIRRFSADDWRIRQAAQDALVELGDDATAALAATTQSTRDEETRSRAVSALAQIAEDRAIGASHVTLHLHNVSPKAAFAQLAAQCHAPLEPITPVFWQQTPAATVSVDVDRVPFWKAMQTLSDQTGICLQEWDAGLRLSNGPLIAGPPCVSESYLVTADSISRNQSITFGPSAERVDQMTLSLMLTAEPKLKVLRASQSALLIEATDENGNSLLPDDKIDPETSVIGDAPRWNCSATLQYPKHNPGTRLTIVRGSFHVTLVVRTEQLTFSLRNAASQSLKTAGGMTVTVKSTSTLPNSQTQVQLSVIPPGGMSNNPDLSDQLARPTAAIMLDANNQPLGRQSTQINSDAQHVDLTLVFSTSTSEDGVRIGEADHFIVQVISATKEQTIPFEFKDLPLP